MIAKKLSEKGLALNQLVTHAIQERTSWLRKLLDPRRDVDAECGHPATMDLKEYKELFLRGDMASRVVSVLPEESWNDSPSVFETNEEGVTDFEKKWDELLVQFNIWAVLTRADILSGIGRFGIVLIGIDDGGDLKTAAPGVSPTGEIDVNGKEHKLLYLRPFDESLVTINTLVSDKTNPRYGLPEEYSVQFADTTQTTGVSSNPPSNTTEMKIHWSRIIHLADNRMSSDVYGLPRMEKVLNRILDVKKIAGGSGEMFWKGGFPGISLEGLPGAEDVVLDVEATKAQLERYMNGLQRYLATVGMSAKSLVVQVADPTPHLEVQIRLISIALGVPWRVLMGSEAAQLASEQDTRAWNRRLTRRRQEYLTPYLIRPLIDRLRAFKVLPDPKQVLVSWPDLNTPGDKERAEVASKRTDALSKYVLSGVNALIPPFEYLTNVLGMKDEEARMCIKAAGDKLDEIDERRAGAPDPEASQEGAVGAGEGRNGFSGGGRGA